MIKKGYIGVCVVLEFKVFYVVKDIFFGCFFFRGDDGFDMGMFLDFELFMLLLEYFF